MGSAPRRFIYGNRATIFLCRGRAGFAFVGDAYMRPVSFWRRDDNGTTTGGCPYGRNIPAAKRRVAMTGRPRALREIETPGP